MDQRKLVCAVFLGAALIAGMLTGCSAEAKKARHLDRGESYLKDGDFEKARIEFLNVLRLEPLNARAIRQIGYLLHEQGAVLSSYKYLAKAVELMPQDTEIALKLASAQVAIGEWKKGQDVAVAVLGKDPANKDAIVVLAESAMTPELTATATQWLERVRPAASTKAEFHLATAQLALRRNDLAAAEAGVRQAIAVEPKSAAAHVALGDWYRSKSNYALAEQEFKTAMAGAPARSIAPLKYAELKANTAALPEAKKVLKDVTDKAPDFLPAWMLLSQIALSEKNYDECISISERILNADQLNFRARQSMAQAKLAKGQTVQAIQDLEALNTLLPKSPQTKYQLAVAYLQTTNIDRAASALEQAINLNTNYTEAILLQGRLNLSKGDAAAVVNSMLSLVKRQPDARAAYVLLADGYRALRRPDDALAVLRGLVRSNPKDPQAPFLLGIMLREQGKAAEARVQLEAAFALSPDNLPVLYQIIDLEIAVKDYAGALKRLEGEIQRRPNIGGLYFLEASVHRAQGNLDRAEELLKKTLELDPDFVSAYQLLAQTYVAGKKLDKATEQLEGLLTNKPRDLRSLMLLGTIYEQAKEFEKARETYEKILVVNSLAVPALNNLAYLYAEHLGNVQKGHDLARKARTIKPEDSFVADTLGWILFKQKEYREAVTILQESASKNPLPEIQYHLGMAHYMMGQVEPARLALQRALASPDAFPGKEDAQKHLALLMASGTPTGGDWASQGETGQKMDPNDIVTRLRLAAANEGRGANENAAKLYEEVLTINPQSTQALVKLARLYAGPLRNPDKAMDLIKRARELSPNDPEASHLLGKLVFQGGDHTYAYSLLRETSIRHTNSAELFYDLGWAAYSIGQSAEANQAMQRSLAMAPQNPFADATKWFLMMTGITDSTADPSTSEARVRELLKTDPTHVPALMALGMIQWRRGEIAPATETFEKALARFPKLAQAQRNLAALYSTTPGKEGRAFELATTARTVLRNDPGLAKTLGRLSYGRKDYRYAVTLLEEGLRAGPPDAASLFMLGMSQYQLKDQAASAATLQKALAAGLPEPSASEARRVLANLQK